MKFWNKHPEVRKRCWTKVELPQDEGDIWAYPPNHRRYTGWYQRRPFANVKRELQNNPGNGKFYMTIMKKEIWFERGEDATWYILTR